MDRYDVFSGPGPVILFLLVPGMEQEALETWNGSLEWGFSSAWHYDVAICLWVALRRWIFGRDEGLLPSVGLKQQTVFTVV